MTLDPLGAARNPARQEPYRTRRGYCRNSICYSLNHESAVIQAAIDWLHCKPRRSEMVLSAVRSCRKSLRMLSLALPGTFPFTVESVQIESLKIEIPADPTNHVFMLLVVAVADDLQEQCKAMWATHILGGTSVLTRYTDRRRAIGLGRGVAGVSASNRRSGRCI